MPTPYEEREQRVFKRVVGRLVPFMFICYVVAYIDRVNIGFAADQMQKDLGMSNSVYGQGAGLFFLGYFLFEIPSNLILERVGARVWIARIMIVWGLVSMAMMFVVGQWSFYSMRVLLGLAEAGFFPGMILFLTYWIPARERAKTGALFMMAIPVAMLVGAPISEALLKLDGLGGLHGWQWLFIMEGIPAVVLGLMALRFLTDRPEKADWLQADDREWLSREMQKERSQRASGKHAGFGALRDPKVAILCVIYFLNNMATYGVFLFLPKILRETSGYSGLRLAAITSLPFVMALVGMIVIGRHSDRTGERKKHVAACALLASIGLAMAAAFQHSVPMIVLSFMLSQLGQRSILGPFWSIPPLLLGGTAAAAGIALINSVGNLGGWAGPHIMGWLRDRSPGYAPGLLVLAGALVLEAILALSLRLPSRPPVPSLAVGSRPPVTAP
jgi:ACS family tartrate transporter-like MFS transporter